MPRKRTPPINDPGKFARMLLDARHAAHKNTIQCATECGLSRSFLSHIERGDGTPELDRCPAIAAAYGVDASKLCWTWICQWAPAAVPALASRGLEDNPQVQQHYRDQWEKSVIGGVIPGEPAVVKDYRMIGPRGGNPPAPAAPVTVTAPVTDKGVL